MEGLKSTILKQDIALAKKLQNVGNWKKRLNFNDDELRERQKSKFHGHPRAIDESEEESDPSPPTPSSSVSSINANLFKEEIIRQALNGNQMVKDFSVMLNQEQNHDYVSPKNDLIFGGDNLDFLQNYNKSMKDIRTKKYVDSAIEMKTSENRRSKVRVFEEKNRRKLKIDNRKCSNVQKNDIIDSLFDKKFKLVVEKILHGLNDVLLILEKGTPEADGEEDYVKRFDRVKGFSSRFVMNYLYPLEQQLKYFEHGKPQTPNQKLITCYHLVCQGVQSYHNHLPTSVGKCAFEKMISLMSDLIKICDIHVGLIENLDESISQEYIYSLKKKAEQLIPKLTEIFRSKSNESLLKSNNTRTSLVSKNAKSTKNNKNRKFQNRYAMYSSSNFYRKDVAFKKAMDQVSKKKFDVKSKYKTATFKHRPPVEKIEETNGNIFQNPKSFFAKRSSSIIRSSPVLSARIDDTVKTQIEVETLQPHTTPNDSKECRTTYVMLLLDLVASQKPHSRLTVKQAKIKNNHFHLGDISIYSSILTLH
ncbi:unnamed protein product [Brassicogethes aeneus]|uniref:Uncharacterized protein n=1 Tax=Brassicogethes aeneus TaxID=1431903 RepID=A0A9P0BHG5_BRAAE|nr:unnamed protein product [Brassicogethes aeneus]